jgi:dihydrofolate reductase
VARLIASGITSLDGYIEDENGKFDWSVPSEEVHAFVNDRERSVGTYLYGRRLYETMSAWESMHDRPGMPAAALDYAQLWQAADKLVYSTTLQAPATAKTRIERVFDPAAVRALKEAARADVSVGGPELAAHAFRAGLVDEVQLYVTPVVVGGGKPFLPRGAGFGLSLVSEHRFANGVLHLRYETVR